MKRGVLASACAGARTLRAYRRREYAQADPNARCGGGDGGGGGTALHLAAGFGDGNAAAVRALVRAGEL